MRTRRPRKFSSVENQNSRFDGIDKQHYESINQSELEDEINFDDDIIGKDDRYEDNNIYDESYMDIEEQTDVNPPPLVITEKEYKRKKKRIKNKPKLISPFMRALVRLLILVYILGIFLGVGFGTYKFKEYIKDAPKLDSSKLALTEPSLVVDASGNKLMELGMVNRKIINKSEIPQKLKDAIISVEDRRFYKHHGFDPIRIGKAVELSLRGRFGEQGGSTLTQQLVKLTYLDQNEDSIKRKAQELYLSWKMEGEYSKEDILSQYINTVYLGNGVYGMKTGAYYYYGKDIKDLTIPQIATIAGIPNSPDNYNPYSNLKSAKYRRDIVLLSMRDNGVISNEDYKKYISIPVNEGLVPKKSQDSLNSGNELYATYLNQIKKEALDAVGNRIYKERLTIKTNLDRQSQKYAYYLVNTNKYYNYYDKSLLVSFVAIENKTGKVIMMNGGSREKIPEINGFNYVTDLKRQPGSSIKPILAYAPAVEYLGWKQTTPIIDEPTTYLDGTPFTNYDRNYLGKINLRLGLVTSRNVPAVKTFRAVGFKKGFDFAEKVGIKFPKDQRFESAVLGSVSNANPYNMGGAFSMFGNNGIYTHPHVITSIEDSKGRELYREPINKKIMSKSSAKEMDKMLRGVVTDIYGTGQEMKKSKYKIRAKTGTTNFTEEEMRVANMPNRAAPDIWFAGYDDKYTVVTWIGYDNRISYIPLEQQKISQHLSLLIFDELHRTEKDREKGVN